jgi:hypothetical protein
MWDPKRHRKPTLFVRLFGSLLLRHAARAFLWLLFHDPPRNTRRQSTGDPTGRSRQRE